MLTIISPSFFALIDAVQWPRSLGRHLKLLFVEFALFCACMHSICLNAAECKEGEEQSALPLGLSKETSLLLWKTVEKASQKQSFLELIEGRRSQEAKEVVLLIGSVSADTLSQLPAWIEGIDHVGKRKIDKKPDLLTDAALDTRLLEELTIFSKDDPTRLSTLAQRDGSSVDPSLGLPRVYPSLSSSLYIDATFPFTSSMSMKEQWSHQLLTYLFLRQKIQNIKAILFIMESNLLFDPMRHEDWEQSIRYFNSFFEDIQSVQTHSFFIFMQNTETYTQEEIYTTMRAKQQNEVAKKDLAQDSVSIKIYDFILSEYAKQNDRIHLVTRLDRSSEVKINQQLDKIKSQISVILFASPLLLLLKDAIIHLPLYEQATRWEREYHSMIKEQDEMNSLVDPLWQEEYVISKKIEAERLDLLWQAIQDTHQEKKH